ncbi:MAG: CHASE3 domain-containing protein, partial [Bradyrhizobium sp.]|nr:CHASE3 domain-containing protein [Bradyrhizobium sp.]
MAIGLGLGTLLAVGSASVALDLKSRDDAALVDHTMEVLQKSSDLRLLLRQVESASRAFALTADDRFVAEFQDARQRVPAALADLLHAVNDNAAQVTRLTSIDEVVKRRLDLSGRLIQLRAANNQAALDNLLAGGPGRAAMATITATLDAFNAEERRLLAARTETSQRTGAWLLMIDLAG